jgi:SagB-type dehydrogenase family enzyme
MKGIGPEFMRQTRLSALSESDQERGLPQPPLAWQPDPSMEVIELPEPAVAAPYKDLFTVINARRTHRQYSEDPLSLAELAYLLWCTQGVQDVTSRPATLRPVPSASARHAFETLVLINRVTDLEPGLYRYAALEHGLVRIDAPEDLAEKLAVASGDQQHVIDSAVTFIWVAIPYRMTWRAGDRGYRYLYIDAGHVCQNLYLSAESLDCGVCAIAGFDDDAVNDLLTLDGASEFAIYIGTVGRKP